METQGKVYLAADIGAGSGRLIAGIFRQDQLRLEEIHRFENQPIELGGGLHWNVGQLFASVREGIQIALQRYGRAVRSIGVDTWGVDYGLLDREGRLLGMPYCYRDPRNQRVIGQANRILPQKERFALAGIQFLPFNTLYQLLAERECGDSLLGKASKLLFMPDLLNYWLSGQMAQEVTIASTGELLDVRSGGWSREILSAYGLPETLFAGLLEPGSVIGTLLPSVSGGKGDGVKVVAVPSHDTAAAVAGCPLGDSRSIYLSSGTWSLMGVESTDVFNTSRANELGLTNERGVEGTTRLLKNISGFWLLQECRRDWAARGLDYSYDTLREMARQSPADGLRIDPNDSRFLAPGNMLARMGAYLQESGQNPDPSPGVLVRGLFEGLARSYREVKEKLESVTGARYERLHIIGGGSQNAFLNQLTAQEAGCEVLAGPVEASCIGNLLSQLKADGEIADRGEGRLLVARSFETSRFG